MFGTAAQLSYGSAPLLRAQSLYPDDPRTAIQNTQTNGLDADMMLHCHHCHKIGCTSGSNLKIDGSGRCRHREEDEDGKRKENRNGSIYCLHHASG